MAGYSERDWMCLRKWRYDHKVDAKTEAQRMNNSPRHVGEFRAYKCPFGDHYHVGRIPGRRYATSC